MTWKPLNLGIPAHVDANKTALTEHLLYAAGAGPLLAAWTQAQRIPTRSCWNVSAEPHSSRRWPRCGLTTCRSTWLTSLTIPMSSPIYATGMVNIRFGATDAEGFDPFTLEDRATRPIVEWAVDARLTQA